jgi:chromosomal replication initiator protein
LTRTDTELWPQVLDAIRGEIGAERFNLWFSNTKPLLGAEGELVVGVPNLFVLEWMRAHYGDLVRSCAEKAAGAACRVRFEVEPSLFRLRRRDQAEQEAAFFTAAARGALQTPAELLERTNPRMRLENFVVGDGNRLAYTAACEVVRAPGHVFNPLFIHGACGLGKTHLLQGVAAAFGLANAGRSCLYLSCEDFTNQYITAMRTRGLDSFRARFRRLDVLILDDVHFLTNKNATQEEFLHTFNALVDGTGKQVVLASDSHPKTIGQLKEGLIARFVSGMVARIDPPDEPTRLRILEQKAARFNAAFEPGVLEFVAHRLDSSVRELEGALTMLVAHAGLAGSRVTLAVAREVVARVAHAELGLTGLTDVENVVAGYFGVTARDLRSASRNRTLTFPRQVAMFLARKHTECSLAEIGQRFGQRDHSTVAAAHKRLAKLLQADPSIQHLLTHLESLLHRRDK